MTDLVILGATGFVGSSISRLAEERQLVWKGVSRRGNANSNAVSIDDSEEVEKILAARPIVINAAGGLKPRDFIENFEFSVEAFWSVFKQTEQLLYKYPPSRLIHISSAGTVYGESSQPSKESDETSPKSWYGRLKKIEESLFFTIANNLNISYACARVTNPFGNTNAINHGFIDVLLNKVNSGDKFVANFPPGAHRDFIYAPTMAKYLLALALSEESGIFNIGSGTSVSLNEILNTVEKIAPSSKIYRNGVVSSDVVSSMVCVEKFLCTFPSEEHEVSVLEYIKQNLDC